MQETLNHFPEKLLRLEELMKTSAGKNLARERTRRLEAFAGWWEEEAQIPELGFW